MTATLIENLICVLRTDVYSFIRGFGTKKKKKKVQSVNKLIPMELQNGNERNDGSFEGYIEFLYRLE